MALTMGGTPAWLLSGILTFNTSCPPIYTFCTKSKVTGTDIKFLRNHNFFQNSLVARKHRSFWLLCSSTMLGYSETTVILPTLLEHNAWLLGNQGYFGYFAREHGLVIGNQGHFGYFTRAQCLVTRQHRSFCLLCSNTMLGYSETKPILATLLEHNAWFSGNAGRLGYFSRAQC